MNPREIDEDGAFDFGRIPEAIFHGVEFLEKKQLPSGEFATYLGSDPEISDGTYDSSPFVTAHVLHALHEVDFPAIEMLSRKALNFLKEEREIGGLWRYYGRRQWKHCRIPPDLDDTACASHVLRLYGMSRERNRWVFRKCRSKEGLFLTWIEPRKDTPIFCRLRLCRFVGEWIARFQTPEKPDSMRDVERFQLEQDEVPLNDCDPVVNANVLMYLGDQPETSAVAPYLKEIVRVGPSQGFSLYYDNPVSLFYAISRAYLSGSNSLKALGNLVTEKLESVQRSDGSWGSPLYTAMSVSVLLAFSGSRERIIKAVSQLLDCQCADGCWSAEAFYRGPTEFWGSEELTVATVLEALNRFHQSEK